MTAPKEPLPPLTEQELEAAKDGWDVGKKSALVRRLVSEVRRLRAQVDAQCACSVAERDSGHRVDCWRAEAQHE